MNSEQFRLLGIESDYFAADGSFVRVPEEVLASLAAILTAPGQPFFADFDEVFTIAPEMVSLISVGGVLSRCAAAYLLDEKGNSLPYSFVMMEGERIELPPLPAGYYTLELHGAHQMRRCLVIVAPQRVYQPEALRRGERLSGINVQLYSLRSAHNWGIGDLGDLRRLVADFAADGIDFLGINPLHALFTTRPNWASPYSPSSRRWLNPIYIDVGGMPLFQTSPSAQAWFSDAETQAILQRLREADWVDYAQVMALKLRALRLIFHDFDAQEMFADSREAFAEFLQRGGRDLRLFATFEALDHYFYAQTASIPFSEDSVGWLGWPEAYRYPDSAAVRAFAVSHEADIRFYMWLQWLMAEQLDILRLACHEAGMNLRLYGDLAVGVSRGGADTWMHREMYCLQVSIGAPPDELGPAGQNWNLPPLHPQRLKRSGYRVFIEMLRANMRVYGILRIDHVMALCRLWWIAYGNNANFGAYVRYPLADLMAILSLESHRERCVVVGEDLGIVPEEMRKALRDYGVYSYSVMYFNHNNGYYWMPEDYHDQSLAVLSTHDLPPLLGFWTGNDVETMHELGIFETQEQYQRILEQRRVRKQQMLAALRQADVIDTSHDGEILDEAIVLALHRFVAMSRSKLFAIQPENLLPITASFNIPGIANAYPNWRYRLPEDIAAMGKDPQLHTLLRQIVATRAYIRERRPSAVVVPAPVAKLIGGVEVTSVDKYLIDQLFAGTFADPFSYLGPHESGNGLVIRVLLPGADAVRVLAKNGKGGKGSKKVLAEMSVLDERGFFIANLDADPRLHYLLEVQYGEQKMIIEDTYRFTSTLQDFDNWLLAEGTHLRPYEKFGAHLVEHDDGVAGVNFSVWAPNARRVSVVGDFNLWDGRRHVMRFHPQSGIWDIFIPDLGEGALYKYEILDANGNIRLKSDPYAFAAQMRPETASVVAKLPEKQPYNPERIAVNGIDAPISIYEVHLGSWRRNPENNYWLTYEQLGDELISYVKEMGFTHIELLPLSEFPFDGSWGYQPLGLYAPTSRFGSPQALCDFIRKAHEAGIYVLLDWVVGHFPTDEFGLVRFDGTPLYEHADPREGYHQDWNTLIYNFGRHEVRNFLTGNALYWVEHYGVDGLRVDAVASMIYRDYSRKDGEWVPNQYGGRENLEAINFLQRTNAILQNEQRGAVSIAEESTAFTGVSHPTEIGGLGFQFKWNMGWMNDTLRYMREEPIHRKYHHNLLTFGMIYQYSEHFVLPLSHDEVVHGKGSLLSKMPGDCWQQFANLRAYYGYMWGYPGKKLLFMGGEFAQGREWNYQESLDWHLLAPEHGGWHEGVQRWVRDLNHAYRAHPALWKQDCQPEGFEWLVVDDAEQSVVAFARHDGKGNPVVIISNFTPVPRENYRIGVSQAGTYHEILNSDDAQYNGSGMSGGKTVHTDDIGSHGKPHSLNLTLPPLATIFLALDTGAEG